MTPWATFFSAEVGAAAALTGLVVVAISVNLARILAEPGLPGRAAEVVIILSCALVVASVMLIPDQAEVALGGETLALGVVSLAASVLIPALSARRPVRLGVLMLVVRSGVNAAAGLPLIVAGLLIMRDLPAGLYWAAGGVIGSLVAGVLGAWVLLVEILR
jgi:modulator of FtsH protease